MPLNAQQTADREAGTWAVEWGAGLDLPDVVWPADLGEPPPPLMLSALRQALASFPAGTGLGWDALHPRALLRLPDSLLSAMVRLLLLCEKTASSGCFGCRCAATQACWRAPTHRTVPNAAQDMDATSP